MFFRQSNINNTLHTINCIIHHFSHNIKYILWWLLLIQEIHNFYLCIIFIYVSRYIGCCFNLSGWILNFTRARCRVKFLSTSNQPELFVFVTSLIQTHTLTVVKWGCCPLHHQMWNMEVIEIKLNREFYSGIRVTWAECISDSVVDFVPGEEIEIRTVKNMSRVSSTGITKIAIGFLNSGMLILHKSFIAV